MDTANYFQEIGLTVIELPIEVQNNIPIYGAFIKEIPTIQAEGNTKQGAFRLLIEQYLAYRIAHGYSEEVEEEKTEKLSFDELLRYYDGETFDGVDILGRSNEESS